MLSTYKVTLRRRTFPGQTTISVKSAKDEFMAHSIGNRLMGVSEVSLWITSNVRDAVPQ
jgi:hypothetical protein